MLIQGLTNLPRDYVRRIIVMSDTAIVVLCAYAALLFLGRSPLENLTAGEHALMVAVLLALGPTAVTQFGLHRIKLVMFNVRDVANLALAAICMSVVFGTMCWAVGVPHSASSAFVFCLSFFSISVGARVLAVALLSYVRDRRQGREPVAIFGAGGVGIQLASALRQSADMRPAFFFDDSPPLQGMMIGGIPVEASHTMQETLVSHGVKRVFLALPESAGKRTEDVIETLESCGISVRVVPPLAEFLAGGAERSLCRTVTPDELLGRDTVNLETPEIAKSYSGRVVMVTGAGGSIGSELCRQLLNCNPDRIILFEQSEFNLYEVDQKLRSKAKLRNVDIVACLGSVTDPVRVRQVIADQNVDIILHAAAYKHVPIAEENEIEGARNNVVGTKVVADAAVEAKVERFILVSTDKAVRPTNIMGATKRMSELVIQDMQRRTYTTKFSMVRFGNVLGSSGSVLPLFQAQIEAGGPVTVTHSEVSRFFMTITEASRLVLLAGAYAQGGDVFVLDMGKPQKIMDLAKRMIELSGRSVKGAACTKNSVEILVTGLRPGEKLYEELLLDHGNLCPTPNAKILRAKEDMLSAQDVAAMLRELNVAIKTANAAHIRKVISERVEGYHCAKHTNDGSVRVATN